MIVTWASVCGVCTHVYQAHVAWSCCHLGRGWLACHASGVVCSLCMAGCGVWGEEQCLCGHACSTACTTTVQCSLGRCSLWCVRVLLPVCLLSSLVMLRRRKHHMLVARASGPGSPTQDHMSCVSIGPPLSAHSSPRIGCLHVTCSAVQAPTCPFHHWGLWCVLSNLAQQSMCCQWLSNTLVSRSQQELLGPSTACEAANHNGRVTGSLCWEVWGSCRTYGRRCLSTYMFSNARACSTGPSVLLPEHNATCTGHVSGRHIAQQVAARVPDSGLRLSLLLDWSGCRDFSSRPALGLSNPGSA